MSIPDFVLKLREHVGTAPLWLAGATAVIRHPDRERILLVRRSDNGWWTPVTGIIDPGEHPAHTAVREAREEAAVDIRVDRLASLGVSRMVTYANGDRAQYIDHTFACTYLGGEPHPADGENTDARWFAIDDLPDMSPHMLARIEAGLADEERTRLATTTEGTRAEGAPVEDTTAEGAATG
ncbi:MULTISPECIES: NUDIX hydrolase [Dietzia]|uniref:NUDIX domain-containing protein n=1 Tax=Dietzia cinnamea TaxID=321318 RepID=A0AAW5QAC8_9ACTN|nr:MULTISPECIES: NUDIX domain-containing protein [Dietzia]AVM63685.1 NUDIX domain-containing protein [Dietzia sp. oral taxon 368]MCT1638838.1 NUDIX domain-containing protein [Dietzia cinnamea]MCT1711123.1 NUDIX domain-containing protein [Dietzia cinnamea]MCT1864597.1 NUDIX domain-containing protein [Dietzia cinnamea]MCT1886233.1 NUDIX domain-containing protein [Dietzia cinnamea]